MAMEKHGKTSMIDRMIINKWTGVVVRLDSQRVVWWSTPIEAIRVQPPLSSHNLQITQKSKASNRTCCPMGVTSLSLAIVAETQNLEV